MLYSSYSDCSAQPDGKVVSHGHFSLNFSHDFHMLTAIVPCSLNLQYNCIIMGAVSPRELYYHGNYHHGNYHHGNCITMRNVSPWEQYYHGNRMLREGRYEQLWTKSTWCCLHALLLEVWQTMGLPCQSSHVDCPSVVCRLSQGVSSSPPPNLQSWT